MRGKQIDRTKKDSPRRHGDTETSRTFGCGSARLGAIRGGLSRLGRASVPLRGSLFVSVLLLLAVSASGAEKKKVDLDTDRLADVPENKREDLYYPIPDVPMPAGAVMEAGSMLSLPDG